MKNVNNNAKADVYANNDRAELETAFNFGRQKCEGSKANSGYPGTVDRQDNGEVMSNPRPSEMRRRVS